MTTEEANNLAPGIYVVYWKDGTEALAAVGRLNDGSRWLSSTTFTAEAATGIAKIDQWPNIIRVHLVFSQSKQ